MESRTSRMKDRAEPRQSAASLPRPGPGATRHEPKTQLPFQHSVGYLISDSHRLLYRALQAKLVPFRVAAGTWHFLRAIWQEDGLTQRELSRRVGILEATTGAALEKLEKAGCVRRTRNGKDRRKINVFLTPRGRQYAEYLIPIAVDLNNAALRGFSDREVREVLAYLARIRNNLRDGRWA